MKISPYDEVVCLCQLPVPENDTSEIDFNSITYQTKDLDRMLEVYTITKKRNIIVMDEPYERTLKMSMYGISNGYWIEYKLSIDNGKVVRIELTEFRNRNFLGES
tara:strand:- start:69 stop:383 length:315 start_codon:yes stop_codon:yes gene_type:complete